MVPVQQDLGVATSPPAADVKFRVSVDVAQLQRGLGAVRVMAGEDETRPHMRAVLLRASGMDLTLCAIDGHCMALWEGVGMNAVDGEVLLPLPFVDELLRATRKMVAYSRVTISVKDSTIGYAAITPGDSVLLDFAPVNAAFPPFRQVIPKQGRTPVICGISSTLLAKAAKALEAAWPHRGWKRANEPDPAPGAMLEFGDKDEPVVFSSAEVPQLTILVMPYVTSLAPRREMPKKVG